jgi:hypothetical protein
MFASSAGSCLRRVAVRGAISAVAVVLASGGLATVGATSAYAASQLACNGGGGVTIDKQIDGTYKWVLSGAGTCNNPQGDPVRQAVITGLATTQTLGYCSDSDTVDAFAMNVAITWTTFSPTRGAVSTLEHQVWSLPATTFPVVTPFTVGDQGGNTLGLGEISTHIFGMCPPKGQPSMQVAWVQSTT